MKALAEVGRHWLKILEGVNGLDAGAPGPGEPVTDESIVELWHTMLPLINWERRTSDPGVGSWLHRELRRVVDRRPTLAWGKPETAPAKVLTLVRCSPDAEAGDG